MTSKELLEEIAIELDNIEITLNELKHLYEDVKQKEVSVRNKAAAAAFLSQFYNGIENILKRISRYHEVKLPEGDLWHAELFKRFCKPSMQPLPILFDNALAADLAPYRKFRHVFYHGYGFQLDWERMKEGIEKAQSTFDQFKNAIAAYLKTI
jgi:hypothetical protein